MAKTNALTDWLGIPPGEQPPHYYRLLGLKQFTNDRGKIDAAAEKALKRVRKQAGENHKAAAAKLVGMIDTARNCLLNAEYKSAYDDQLRASGGTAPIVGDALPEPMELNQVVKSVESSSVTAVRKKVSPLVISAAGGVVGVLLALVFAFSGWFGGEEDHEPIPDGQQLANNNEVTTPQSNTPESEPPPSISEAQPDTSTVPGDTPPSTDKNTTTTNGSPVSTNTAPADSAVVKTVNLLEQIDPKRDAISGKWAMENGVLLSGGGKYSRLIITNDAPQEYELHVSAMRTGTMEQASWFAMDLIGGESRFSATLDYFRGWTNGLQRVDGKTLLENETARRASAPLLKIGVESQIVYRVDGNGVNVTVNGTTIIDWKGDFSRLSLPPQSEPNTNKQLAIGSRGPFTISKIELRSLEMPRSLPQPKPRVVNLLKRIDPREHTVKGAWKFDNGGLVNSSVGHIRIPFVPAEEYELHFTAQLLPGRHSNPFFVVGLVGGGRRFAVQMNETRFGIPHRNGLTILDEKPFSSNETYVVADLFPEKIPVNIVCQVLRDGVTITVAGEAVIKWKGDYARLSESPEWGTPIRKELMIAVGKSPYRITKIAYRSLDGSQPPPTPRVVNLLRRIIPQTHSIAGKWTQDGGTLVNHGGQNSRLQIPYSLPEEYQLNITATQLSARGGLIVGLVAGGRQFTAIFDFGGRYTGLHVLDRNRGMSANKSAFDGRLFKQGVPNDIVCKVQKTGVSLTINGRTVVDWKGEFSRLSPYDIGGYSIPNKTSLFIGGESAFRFSKFELRRVGVSTPPPTPRIVNLLKRIDPKKHAVHGEWLLDGETLVSKGGKFASLQIPYLPPSEYELHVTASRTIASREPGLNIGLVAGGKNFGVILDHAGRYSGLHVLDGKRLQDNGSVVSKAVLKTGQPVEIICRVTKSGVRVSVDGSTVFDWKGKFSRLSQYAPISKIPNERQLWIAGDSQFRFTKIELHPLGTAASIQSDRLAIPAIAAQQKSSKLIRELFKKEYASLKRVTEKLKLAEKLLEQGRMSDDDPVACYVLLQEAKRLAIDGGDTALTMDAVDSILWHFDVDPPSETMAVLRKLAGSVRFPANGKAVADAAFAYAKSAYEAGQVETALDFLKMASSTATKFRQRPLAKEILDFRRNIIALKQRDDDAAKASQTLVENPDDPKANLVWGSYLCYIKKDWTAGLPLLAKGDNAGLKAVVELEIATPADAEQMQAAADAWWKLAQSKKANRFQKSQWLARAGHWYGKAVGELTGLQKTLVEKRLKEIAATTSNVER